ncbi:WNT8B [Branchiostoma lanceolatum]|uniref:Protein Wnt n=1 Tax=Branchiostoma lanceolatum TaxID=7740 RepID=A0A8J9Z2S9_BRALA|nr:WNT8B [Branchiostoma lanceolatum]
MLFARVLWSMSVLFAVLSRTVESNGWTLQSNFLIAGPKSSFQASLTYASSVAAGAQTAMEECKYQFSLDRWNCTDNALSMLKPNTLPGIEHLCEQHKCTVRRETGEGGLEFRTFVPPTIVILARY